MKHLKTPLLLFILFMISFPAHAQSADEVINNYIKAIGGYDKIKTINTARVHAKLSSSTANVNVIITFKKPNMMMSEMNSGGITMKQAYDGKIGWSIYLFGDNPQPYIIPEDQLKVMTKESDLAGPLVNYKEKGNKVELLGKDKMGDTEVFKLNLIDKNGDNNIYFIDTEKYLILKEIRVYKFGDREDQSEMVYSDYQSVDGFLFPFSYDILVSVNPADNQKVRVEKVETNIPVEEDFFKTPPTNSK